MDLQTGEQINPRHDRRSKVVADEGKAREGCRQFTRIPVFRAQGTTCSSTWPHQQESDFGLRALLNQGAILIITPPVRNLFSACLSP